MPHYLASLLFPFENDQVFSFDTNRTELRHCSERFDRAGYGHGFAVGVYFLCIISMLESFGPFSFVALLGSSSEKVY